MLTFIQMERMRIYIMKKQSRNTHLVLSLIPFIIALSLFVFMFLNAVVLKNNQGDIIGQYTGAQVAFGFKESGLLGDLVIKFNLLFVLVYLLPLLLTVSIVVLGILKKDKVASMLAILLTVSFVLSIVGLFIMPSSTNLYTVTGIGTVFNSLAELGYQLSTTTIIAAVLSIIAALVSIGQIALGFVKK